MKRLNLLLLVLLTATVWAADAREELAKKIAGQLSCICDTCPHIVVARCDCGTAAQMYGEIRQMVAAGKTETEVMTAFEQKYGAEVLGAPKPEGFNLLAWVTPFVGLAFGLAVVILVVRRLRPDPVREDAPVRRSEIDPKYQELLERELRE